MKPEYADHGDGDKVSGEDDQAIVLGQSDVIAEGKEDKQDPKKGVSKSTHPLSPSMKSNKQNNYGNMNYGAKPQICRRGLFEDRAEHKHHLLLCKRCRRIRWKKQRKKKDEKDHGPFSASSHNSTYNA